MDGHARRAAARSETGVKNGSLVKPSAQGFTIQTPAFRMLGTLPGNRPRKAEGRSGNVMPMVGPACCAYRGHRATGGV